ncbi:MAG: aldose epimerase family protein [Clostridia bacterium]
MILTKKPFGSLPTGETVALYTLTNTRGASVCIATYGGTLVSINVPDASGLFGDVLLGYDQLDAMRQASGYMGMLIGRFANRIGGAQFSLGGKTYQLAANNGVNHLHGGVHGLHHKVWEATAGDDCLILRCESPDGEENYPGTLAVQVTYTWSETCALGIHYQAVCDQDTVINLTNHAYFNLSGPACPTILQHEIQIDAEAITAVADSACIPTGELRPVADTPFDLRTFRTIGEGLDQADEQLRFGNGYDHNFVLYPAQGGVRRIAQVRDRASGRQMEVYTDQPGVQFYTGNSIKSDFPGKLGVPYHARQGLCLETQTFPDGIHHPTFPSCVLKAGDTFDSTTRFGFSTYTNR